MTDEERKFKVLQVEKYSEQKNKAERAAAINTVSLMIAVSSAVVGFVSNDTLPDIVAMLLRGLGVFVSFVELPLMIEAISKKIALQIKIEDIRDELNFYDKQDVEKRGRKK